MDVDEFKRFAIWSVLALYFSFFGVYVGVMNNSVERVNVVMSAVCAALILGFIELAVKGYKKSIERFSKKMRAIPMGKFRDGSERDEWQE